MFTLLLGIKQIKPHTNKVVSSSVNLLHLISKEIFKGMQYVMTFFLPTVTFYEHTILVPVVE